MHAPGWHLVYCVEVAAVLTNVSAANLPACRFRRGVKVPAMSRASEADDNFDEVLPRTQP